jgi:hypothetical protein
MVEKKGLEYSTHKAWVCSPVLQKEKTQKKSKIFAISENYMK